MRGGRFLWFLISLAIGIVLGLAAGWAAAPLRAHASSAQDLQPADKTEWVLMVAEVYAADGDAAAAAQRLAQLSAPPVLRVAQEAIINATQLGYTQSDLDTMARLVQGLQSLPTTEPQP